MTDAFDQWTEWRHKPPDDRRAIPADLYSAVMSLPKAGRSDRQTVNEAVRRRREARRDGRTVWMYLNDHDDRTSRMIGDSQWVKVFASADAAEKWLNENDPEGVAWEYELEGRRGERSIWLYSSDPASRAIGDPDWVKLFGSYEAASKWIKNNDPAGKLWQYPVQE
jgi:hypothetical protein